MKEIQVKNCNSSQSFMIPLTSRHRFFSKRKVLEPSLLFLEPKANHGPRQTSRTRCSKGFTFRSGCEEIREMHPSLLNCRDFICIYFFYFAVQCNYLYAKICNNIYMENYTEMTAETAFLVLYKTKKSKEMHFSICSKR